VRVNVFSAVFRSYQSRFLGQRGRSGPMQGGAHRHLHRFQVETLALTPLAEDHSQQTIYFLGHFPVERLSRFFSCSLNFSSPATGRNGQIASLTSRSRRPSSRKR